MLHITYDTPDIILPLLVGQFSLTKQEWRNLSNQTIDHNESIFWGAYFQQILWFFFCEKKKKKKLRKTHATFKILWNNCKMSKLYKLLCWDINTMNQILRLLPEPICWSFQQYTIWLQKITIWIDNNLMLLSCIIM